MDESEKKSKQGAGLRAYWDAVKRGEIPPPSRMGPGPAARARQKIEHGDRMRAYWARVRAGELPAPRHGKRSSAHKAAIAAGMKKHWDRVKSGEAEAPKRPHRYPAAAIKAAERKAAHQRAMGDEAGARRTLAEAQAAEAAIHAEAERRCEGVPIEKRPEAMIAAVRAVRAERRKAADRAKIKASSSSSQDKQ